MALTEMIDILGKHSDSDEPFFLAPCTIGALTDSKTCNQSALRPCPQGILMPKRI